MMRFLFILVVAAAAAFGPVPARADLIDDAWAAVDSELWNDARRLANEAQAQSEDDRTRFEAAEVLATVGYYTDDASTALAAAQQLDRDGADLFGPEAPERQLALSLLGWLYSDLGETGRAIDAMTRAIRIGRGDDQNDGGLQGQMLQLAELYLDGNHSRTAATLAAEVETWAIAAFGDQDGLALEARLLRAAAHLALGHPVEASLHAAPLLQNPDLLADDPYLRDRLGEFRADLSAKAGDDPATLAGWSEQAAERGAARQQQDAASLAVFAQLEPALQAQDFARFDKVLRRATALLTADDPDAALAYLSGIRILLGASAPEAAAYWADRLAEFPAGYLATLDTDVSPPLLDLADLLSRQGNLPDSAAFADLALNIARFRHPEGTLPILQARYRRADIALSMGDGETAARLINVALEQGPPDGPAGAAAFAHTLLLAAELAAASGDFEAANDALEQVLRGGPVSDEVRFETLKSLAMLQMQQGRHARAVPLLEEARTLGETLFGATAPSTNTATALLAAALFESGDEDRALDLYEPLMAQVEAAGTGQEAVRSALALIDMRMQRRSGRADNPVAVDDLPTDDGGGVLSAALAEESWFAGEIAAAERYADTVLSVARPGDPTRQRATLVKARIALDRGEAEAGLSLLRELTEALARSDFSDPRLARAHLALQARAALDLAANKDGSASLALIDEALSASQWANALAARAAFEQAARRWRSDGPLTDELRAVQDARRSVEAARAGLREATAKGTDTATALAALDAAEADLRARSRSLRTDFPDYATAADPRPAGLRDIAASLHPDEVLVVFLSSDEDVQGTPASQVIAVTDRTVATAELPHASDLRSLADDLHCSVAVTDLSCRGLGGDGTRGSFSLEPEPRAAGEIGPAKFEFGLASEAYETTLGPVAAAIDGKSRVILVPDAALLGMPFNVMIATPPTASTTFASADWSIRHRSLQVIPTVSGFIRLRQVASSGATGNAFLGVGDPLVGSQAGGPLDFDCGLIGDGEGDVLAFSRARGAGRGAAAIARLPALPDSRCELQRSAAAWPGPGDLLLHGAATETHLRQLSHSGDLKKYSAITFATHGLIAGEVGAYDAGLVLTPEGDDDGLLTTAEVAQLDLDADIVILSACNTAAGSADSGEGLSGLASAFFYAGARSLMVSSWPVYSDAAVRLSSSSLSRLSGPGNGDPAEALRQSMLDILDDPAATARQLHPSYWAPFMVVGGV